MLNAPNAHAHSTLASIAAQPSFPPPHLCCEVGRRAHALHDDVQCRPAERTLHRRDDSERNLCSAVRRPERRLIYARGRRAQEGKALQDAATVRCELGGRLQRKPLFGTKPYANLLRYPLVPEKGRHTRTSVVQMKETFSIGSS